MATELDTTKWSISFGKNYVAWPFTKFTQVFAGWGEKDEDDWKAAVYRWGGIRPSYIERTWIDVAVEKGVAEGRIYYELKAGVTGEYDATAWNRVRWRRAEVHEDGIRSGDAHQDVGEGDRGQAAGDRREGDTAGETASD